MPTSFTHTDAAPDAITALASSGFDVGPPARAARTVLDTFDGRLHRAGLRLELRDGAVRELVLVGSPDTPAARLTWPREAPRVAGDLPAGPFGSRVHALIGERALLPAFDVTGTSREARRLDKRGKPVVGVVVYEELRSSAAPQASMPAWVGEVVAVAGHAADADRTSSRLEEAGLQRHEHDLIDVALRAAGLSLAARSTSPTIPLDPSADALDGFRAVLGHLSTTVVDNLPGTLDDLDPEFLHELRVAVRRTRSVLAQAKGVIPPEIRDRYRREFGALGAATGRARDLDVYVLGWPATAAPLQLDDPDATAPVLAELQARRTSAHAAMCEVLASDTTRRVLDDWQAWLTAPSAEAGAGPLGPLVARRIGRAQAVLLVQGRAIDSSSPAEQLHDLRKEAKKLRYLLECFGGLMPSGARKGFVSQLKALQDNLGEHQDAEVLRNELRQLAHDLDARGQAGTAALLALGRLIDSLDRRRQAARDEFVQCFRAYDAKDNRRALDDLLAGLARL